MTARPVSVIIEMKRAVGRGITWLDQRLSATWRHDVDWSMLDVDSYEYDVIGQVYGFGMRQRATFVPGTDHIPGSRDAHVIDWETYHGFSVSIRHVELFGEERAAHELSRIWRYMGPDMVYARNSD